MHHDPRHFLVDSAGQLPADKLIEESSQLGARSNMTNCQFKCFRAMIIFTYSGEFFRECFASLRVVNTDL